MATFYTNWYSDTNNTTRLRFVTSETINSDANTSTVTVKAYYQNYNRNLVEDMTSLPVTMVLGGSTYSGSSVVNKADGSWVLMKTISKTISHNADGTGSVSFKGSSTLFSSSMSTGNKTITLTTIGRYGSISNLVVSEIDLNSAHFDYSFSPAACDEIQYSLNGGEWVSKGVPDGWFNIWGLEPGTNYSIVCRIKRTDSQLWATSDTYYFTTLQKGLQVTATEVFTDEENPQMTYWRPQGYNVNLRIEQNVNGTYVNRITRFINSGATNTNVLYTFELTEAERKLLRENCTGNSINLQFVTATIVGGVEKYYDHTLHDRMMKLVNQKPTFTDFTFQDTDSVTIALTGNNQTLIKGKSNLKTIISTNNKMVANKEATAVKYRTNIGTKSALVNYSSTDEVYMNIEDIDSGIIYVTAIDSRGNETQVTKTATIIDHSLPIINQLKLERQNGISSTVNVIGNGTYTNVNFGAYQNTITKIEYSIDNGANWVDITSKFDIANGIFENKESGNTLTGFTTGTEYNIIFRVYDGNGTYLLSSNTSSFSLTSGEPLLDINKTKKGVGINCLAEEEGLTVDELRTIYKNGSNVEISGDLILSSYGIKLGQIIEHGSNSNGTYIKFSDGTLICTKKITGTANCSTTWGQLYETPLLDLGNWPYTFKKLDNYQITQGSSSAAQILETHYGATTTSAGKMILCRATPNTSLSWGVNVLGIGTWK